MSKVRRRAARFAATEALENRVLFDMVYPGDGPVVEETAGKVTVRGRNFSVTVDKANGLLTSYEAHGVRLLDSGAVPNFWRAPTDNDRGNGHHTRNQTWRDAGARRTVTDVSVRVLGTDRAVQVKVGGTLPTATESTYTTTYTVFGNGEIKVDNTLHPVSSRLALGNATSSRFHAFGIDWDDASGTRNGHFAPFAWQG